MGVHFILGGAGRGKSHYINHKIVALAEQDKETTYIMLVPEQATMQTQKEIVQISRSKGMMNIEVQSFIRLAYRVFGETGTASLPVLDDMGKTMILHKVLTDKEQELTYFGRNVHKRGYVAEIKSFLSEMMQYGIDEQGLEDMIDTAKGKVALQKKLRDMQIAYGGFREYLRHHYITSEEVLGVFSSVVSKSDLLRDAVICMDGFTGFTPVQYRLISELMKYCRDIYVTVTLSDCESQEIARPGSKHGLFYMSRKTTSKFLQLMKENHIEEPEIIRLNLPPEHTRFAKAAGIEHLEKNLFRYPSVSCPDLPEDITIHLLKQPQDEVSFVVEKILSLRRKGYRYRDIAVVTGDMEVYGALAKGQFARAQIPCFIDQKKSILAHPFVSMIETLFEVLYTDFAYEPVMKYLKGRYSPLTREQADLVDNYLLATGLRGHKKWMDVWESTRAFPIREEAEKERLTEALNQARELAWNTFRLPEETLGRRKHTVKEFATVFVSFLEQENFYHRLQKDVSDFRDSNKLEQAKEYEQIYGIVLGVLDRMVELLGQEEMSLKSFRELLNTGFSEARVGLIPPQVDQVMVGDLTRTRLHHIKHLFFLGMTDANIPKGAGGGGILSSPERSFLEEQDFELAPTEREKVYTEQFYLYLTLTKPEHHLYLCLCESGNDGKAQNPSYLVDRICQLFPEMKINAEEQNRQEEHILGTDRGFSYLIKGLQNKNYQDKQWKEIYGYYLGQEKYREQIDPVLEAAFYKSPEAKLTREAAKLLYQDILRGSASKFELYASCGYRYFLQYGLQLKERQERAVEFYDIGNIIHRSLELYTKDLIHREKNWQDISEDEQKTKAAEYFHQVITEYKDGILEESFRNRHMISLLQRILHRTIGTITEQMKQGEFRTVGSELRFEQVYGPLLLTGSVDRIDRLETEDTDYISIVDYKTGTKNISLSDLYYGLQMQLVIYLQAAITETKKERDREHIRKKVIPAGIFYYHPEDPMLKEYVEEAGRQKEILKQLRLKGLFNEESEVMYGIDRHLVPASGSGLAGSVKSTVTAIDTKKDGSLTSYTKGAVTESEFDLLMHYTSDKLQEMSHSILEGEIPMKPYRKEDGQEACGFCPYHGVCQFDAKIDGQEYRLIAEKTSEDVMDELTKKYDS